MLHLFLNDLKILKRSWITLLLFLMFSMITSLIIIKAMSPIFEKNIFIKPFSINVVDYDNSIGSRMAISSLNSEGYISRAAEVTVLDEKQAMKQLNEGKSACVVIIPQGFSQSLYLGNNKPVKVYINDNGITTRLAEGYFNNVADLVTAAQSGIYTVYHMMQRSEKGSNEAFNTAEKAIPNFILTAMGRKDVFETLTISNLPQTKPTEYYIVCAAVMFLIFTGILGLRMINQDLESNIIKRIIISPEGILKYIVEKILIMTLVGFAEFIAIMIPFTVYFKSSFSILNIKVILTVLAIILSSTSLCILISVLSKSSETAVTASIITLFIICIAGGCIYPSAIMSDFLKAISDYVFSSWALEGMFWALTDAPLMRIAHLWGNLFAFAAIMTIFSAILIGRGDSKFLHD
ncbi:MAG: ABC transporter permease [Deltaproteobacteria bacterium]